MFLYPTKTQLGFYILLLFSIGGCIATKKVKPDLDMRLNMASKYSAKKSGDAFLIWKDDQLIFEKYQNGYNRDNPHLLREITTLFSSLVALAAANDGLLTLEEPVSETLTEWKDDPQKSQITISQLLHNTSGLEPGNKDSILIHKEAIQVPLIQPPGEGFRFGPNHIQVFGALMDRKTNGSYLKSRILIPIGVPGGRWLIANQGGNKLIKKNQNVTPRYFDGAQLTARELLRVGRLILQKGKWNDEIIIDDISPLTQPKLASPGYGLSVWLNIQIPFDQANKPYNGFFENIPESIIFMQGYKSEKIISSEAPSDLFMAAGRGNQRLYIIPSEKMVIVRFGREDLLWNDAEFLARILSGKSLNGVDTK